MTTTEPIDTLRALYRAACGGAVLDVAAYAEALFQAIADGHELHKIADCFERIGYHTRLDIFGHCEGAGARLRAAKERGGWKGAVRVASALGMSDAWAAAMTAHYGPTGTHESRLGPDGVPTAETLAEFPRIGEAMAEAAARFDRIAAWSDEQNAGRAPDVRHVVWYAPPAGKAA